MPNHTSTIRRFVNFLNNINEHGGFWLPNIQRPFVWKENQIERLYDSILREYPIGTLLVWKTSNPIKIRRFIDLYNDDIKLSNFYEPRQNNYKMLVLDGQQRLQSLFIGLKGSYNQRELFFNILSGDFDSAEDVKFQFKFLSADEAEFPYINFKSIVFTDRSRREIVSSILLNSYVLSDEEKNRVESNVDLVREVFCTQENILYQLVDSIDRPETYSEDDIVEIFIRANSGGTLLEKSDLLFTLLVSSWQESEQEVENLLDDLNLTGYKFKRDFILKTALVVLNAGSKYDVAKFRDPRIKSQIEQNWQSISNSVRFVKDFIYGETFLKTDQTLPSYSSLIPIIYSHFHFPETWNQNSAAMKEYLIKVNLTGVFGGVNDSFMDGIISKIRNSGSFNLTEIFGYIRDQGKTIELSEKSLFEISYESKEIHLLFNIWYGFNYQPALRDNLPNIDHIFPQSELKNIKEINPETGRRTLMKYDKTYRNQIANLMLLTAAENQAQGKGDMLPDVWFTINERDNIDYRNRHLIPDNPELWKLEKFEEFLEERKILILEKFINIGLVRGLDQ